MKPRTLVRVDSSRIVRIWKNPRNPRRIRMTSSDSEDLCDRLDRCARIKLAFCQLRCVRQQLASTFSFFKMSDSNLIELVRSYEELYNLQHQYYSNQQRRDNIWEEIGEVLGENGKLFLITYIITL